jgi:serine/threonine protein kinase
LNAAAAHSPKPPGAIVGGYTLLEEVGRGGMGSVYRATAPDGSTVAVKLLAAHLNDNPILLKRFQQEARLAKKISHPNLVKAIELGEHEGEHFFAMEFVEGESVGARVRRDKRFSEKEAVRTCIAVGEALAAAHAQGLIHRDVKPDNIMLTASGQVKLADMGLAKDTSGEDLNLTRTGRGLGTPHFMAPEQFKEAKSVDVRCDIYSLGATLYMMVTGSLPFRAGNPLDAFIKKSQNDYTPPEQIVPELSPRLVRIIKHAMEANPKKRPQTMLEFIAELKTVGGLRRSADVWYVIYTDGKGQRKKVKGAQPLVAAMIRNRKLTAEATASRQKSGEFVPLSKIAEFATLFQTTPQVTENGSSKPSEPPSDAPPFADVEEPSEATDGSRFESIPASTGRSFFESDPLEGGLHSRVESESFEPTEQIPTSPPESPPFSPFIYIGAVVVIVLLLIAAFLAGRLTN